MAKVFTIEPNPRWVIIDNFSKLPNGAAIYTYSNKNPSVFKPAYQDSAGAVPYGEYIQGFGNGTMPPIFWEFDDAAPDEGYYIRVYDRPKTEPGSNFLWDFDDLFGGGTGGGGTINTFIDIENFVVNSEFYNNCGALSSLDVVQTLAPSNHSGFSGIPLSSNDAPILPDIIFAKSNTSGTHSISFPTMPIGSADFAPNPTPRNFLRYSCTFPGNEAFKIVQFPLIKGLQNTSGLEVGIKLFARLNSATSNNVTLRFRQFYGNGSNSPTSDVYTIISGPLALVLGDWVELTFNNVLIPSIGAGVIGNCENDALFLQIVLPQQEINVDFSLAGVYLGGVPSEIELETKDEVNAIANSPRTGDIRTTLNSVNLGWVRMNDGTIGDASSNATVIGTQTFGLFKHIWDTFNSNQAFAPMYTSAGASVAYGADSVADFNANRRLSLTKNLGRVMVGALPEAASQTFTRSVNTLVVTSTAGFYTGMAVTVSSTLTLPSPLTASTIYYAVVLSATTLSLAATTADAIASTPIVIPLTTAGSGVMTIVSVNSEILGSFIGEESHSLNITEIASHSHTYSNVIGGGATLAGGAGNQIATANTSVTGGQGSSATLGAGNAAVPHNTIQPSVYMNVFIKL